MFVTLTPASRLWITINKLNIICYIYIAILEQLNIVYFYTIWFNLYLRNTTRTQTRLYDKTRFLLQRDIG